MVKLNKCFKCGRKVVDIITLEDGRQVCWNCNDRVDKEEFDFDIELDRLFFRASSIQKMGGRWMIEIPKKSSAELKIERMTERVRTHSWEIMAKSMYSKETTNE